MLTGVFVREARRLFLGTKQMAIETTEKPLWTEGGVCESRVHCDWCPYVPHRPAEYAELGWVFPIKDIHCKEPPFDLLARGIENDWAPPEGRRCPFGVTFEGARALRAQRVVQRVKDGVLTPQGAIDSLTALGIDVDLEAL